MATHASRVIRCIAPLVVAVVLLVGCIPVASTAPATSGATDQALADAYRGRQSGVQVSGTGRVVRILSDDSDGGRHQRFILELDSGQTLLIAHNIDVAPRIPSLIEGDPVEFNGVYEWNDEGGVIHWTHHDPKGVHEAGWLKHKGAVYQ